MLSGRQTHTLHWCPVTHCRSQAVHGHNEFSLFSSNRLLATSISPFIFPSITCFRRQFLRKMWPIQLAFRFLISCRIFLYSLTLSNTFSFLTWSVQLIFSILLQHQDEEEDVRSYWMTLRTGEDILIWRRSLWIALCGGIVLEEALDLSSDRILNG